MTTKRYALPEGCCMQTLRLPVPLSEALDLIATEHGNAPRSAIIRRAIAEFIQRNEASSNVSREESSSPCLK